MALFQRLSSAAKLALAAPRKAARFHGHLRLAAAKLDVLIWSFPRSTMASPTGRLSMHPDIRGNERPALMDFVS